MLLYYEGSDAVITDEAFEALQPWRRRFLIRELADLQVVEHPADRSVTLSGQLCLAAVGVVALVWPLLHSTLAWLFAGLLLLAPLVAWRVCRRLRPQVSELRGRYRGEPVSLYTSDNAVAFERVRRALVRARQQSRPALAPGRMSRSRSYAGPSTVREGPLTRVLNARSSGSGWRAPVVNGDPGPRRPGRPVPAPAGASPGASAGASPGASAGASPGAPVGASGGPIARQRSAA